MSVKKIWIMCTRRYAALLSTQTIYNLIQDESYEIFMKSICNNKIPKLKKTWSIKTKNDKQQFGKISS